MNNHDKKICRSARQGYVPSFVPDAADTQEIAQGIEHFQTAAHDTSVAQQNVTYGLIRQNPTDIKKGKAETDSFATAKALPPPSEAEVLKLDLKQLPSEASLEAYGEMPVESFGEALLRGMGWQEGRAIGRGNKKEITTKDLIRRPHRLGLGAAPVPALETHKKYIKPGESRAPQDHVYVDPTTGVLKSSKDPGAPTSSAFTNHQGKEQQKPGVWAGKVMKIVEGRHHGLLCEVQGLEPKEAGRSARCKVRLVPSYEVVVVRCSDLDEDNGRSGSRRDSRGKGRDGHGNREEHRSGGVGGGGGSRDRHQDGKMDDGGRESKRRKEEDRKVKFNREEEEEPWLVPNIRIKIIDKKLHGGKFYLKKGIIVDVKAPTVCDVFIDGSKESVLDVKQLQLETVVPGTEGTPVQVLVGTYKGQRGRLLQRNTASGLAAVQLLSDMSVRKLSLDNISEYCGPTNGWDD